MCWSNLESSVFDAQVSHVVDLALDVVDAHLDGLELQGSQ
jgi:hypothetical protein